MKKLLKALESAQTALKEAMALKDADQRQKKTLEAQTALDLSIKAIKEASLKPEGESDGQTTIVAGKEDGTPHDPDNPNCECEACQPATEEVVDGDPAKADGGDDGDSHTVVSHKVVKKTGKAAVQQAAQEESRREMQQIAVEKLIESTGIDKKYFDLKALCAMSFREAKADIAKQKRMHEAAVATVLAKVGQTVSASHRARESAAGTEGNDEGTAKEFADIPLLSVAQ